MTLLPSDLENRLARAMQGAFPLEEDPWSALGAPLGLSPTQVLAQARAWHAEGKLREVSAVLEGAALGWDSALVAGAVPAERIEEVAAAVNRHPTVTHNYQRDHRYNLWFTIAVPPEMSLERTLEHLARESGVERFLPLRRTATFKIGVNFDLARLRSLTAARPLAEPPRVRLGEDERRLARALQAPLPLVREPFAALAEGKGFSSEALLAFARAHRGGLIRRYVATFRHRRLGVRGNGMSVWRLSPDRLAEIGPHLAAVPEVSHCYARNPIPGFPYTAYAMIHGPDRASVRAVAARLSRELGVSDYALLFSVREFKKTRLRYFLPELEVWWAEREGVRA
ncbi:MAG: Lrp/AsnC family transcriptional regulator [Planctomycetota bacterium]|nr:MAG: Lrp/AsnC family transcriptional regulator [Planctomycetota bacterium]